MKTTPELVKTGNNIFDLINKPSFYWTHPTAEVLLTCSCSIADIEVSSGCTGGRQLMSCHWVMVMPVTYCNPSTRSVHLYLAAGSSLSYKVDKQTGRKALSIFFYVYYSFIHVEQWNIKRKVFLKVYILGFLP